jgi:hypothetical protein
MEPPISKKFTIQTLDPSDPRMYEHLSREELIKCCAAFSDGMHKMGEKNMKLERQIERLHAQSFKLYRRK